ncbi:MAG: PIG-L deacetylase family protein [Planctomycetota bacterium]
MVIKQKIMAIGAHADDIEAMFGGTLLKYKDQGYEIVYVMTTNNMSGGNSVLNGDDSITRSADGPIVTEKRRKSECDAACDILGTKPIHLDYPQRHYYSPEKGGKEELQYGCKLAEGVKEGTPTILTAHEDKECIARLTDLIMEHNPSVVLTLGIATHNVEHFTTSLMATNAVWSAVEKGFKGALLHGREDNTSLGEANVKWDTYVDISDYLDARMELLGKHSCQMPTAHYPDHGHRLRVMKYGVANGCKAAEVYTWVRRFDVPNMDSTIETYSPLIRELVHNTR